MKKIALVMTLVGLMAAGHGLPVHAAGIVGADIGVMLPDDDLDDASDKGAYLSPYAAYMLNDWIGFMGRVQVWGAEAEHSDDVGFVMAGLFGPRLALPLGPVELWGTFLGGVAGGLNDEFIDDPAWAVAPGGGVNFYIDQHWFVGASGHWHRVQRRVHNPNDVSSNDATYTTIGVGVGYEWGREEDELEMPAAPPPPPAMAEAPPPAPAPAPPVARKKIVLRGVNFDFDKSAIRSDAKPVLDAAIQTLKEEGGVAVIAEGHTDAVGSDAYNQRLSMRRADAVRDYLVAGGISASRIKVEGHGESRPVATNDTEDGRAQNRRTELRVSQ